MAMTNKEVQKKYEELIELLRKGQQEQQEKAQQQLVEQEKAIMSNWWTHHYSQPFPCENDDMGASRKPGDEGSSWWRRTPNVSRNIPQADLTDMLEEQFIFLMDHSKTCKTPIGCHDCRRFENVKYELLRAFEVEQHTMKKRR